MALVGVLDVGCSGDGDGSGEMGEGIVFWMLAVCCWGLMGEDASVVGAGASIHGEGDCVGRFVGELGVKGTVEASGIGKSDQKPCIFHSV